MKVMIIHPGPHFSVSDVYEGLAHGLKANGCDVGMFNLDDRLNFYSEAHIKRGRRFVKALSPDVAIKMANKGLVAQIAEWWPDMVIIVSGFFITPETWAYLARRPHHTVLWCTESPYEDDRQATPAPYADTVILNDPTNLAQFRDINPRTYYLPHSYNPDVHHPNGRTDDLDFVFVGTGFPSRIEFFEQVKWPSPPSFGGNWSLVDDESPIFPHLLDERGVCTDNSETANLYRRAKVTANLYRKETSEGGSNLGWAVGPREIELAACGSFFLREPRPEGDGLFPDLPTFTSPDEFSDLLAFWLPRHDERQVAAFTARAAIADRTFTNTTARLLGLVDGASTNAA